MCHTLVPVPASDKEHGSSISDGSHNGTSRDTSRCGVDLTASSNIASHGTSALGSTSSSALRIARRGGRVAFRRVKTINGNSRVDERNQLSDSFILVIMELLGRCPDLVLKGLVQVLGYIE